MVALLRILGESLLRTATGRFCPVSAAPGAAADRCDLRRCTVMRSDAGSAMDPISFAIFSFLNRIASRAPDFFRIPHEGLSEVGFRVEI